jgi:general secretion pathway protein L
MAQRVIGIDVGSHSVKVVQLTVSMRSFSVTGYHEEPVPQDEGVEGEPRSALERAGEALRALQARGALAGDVFITGLPGDVVTTRLVRLPFSDSRRIDATLRFEVEAQVPYDLDDMVLTSTVLSGQVDKKTDVLVGLAKKSDVAEYLSLLKSVGVDPRHVEMDALALDDLVRHLLARTEDAAPPAVTPGGTTIAAGPDAYLAATAVVDIGHRRTSICVMVEDQVVTARTVLRGGADLTRALARSFHLPLDQAEQGKQREAYLEVPGEKAPYPEQARISQILREALQPVVRELRQSFQAVVAQRRARVRRLYLCGGGARVHNLDRFLADELNVEVRRATAVSEALAPALPVDQWAQGTDMTHAAKALAYALSGYAAGKSERLDFRQGDFAYRGDFEFLEGRAPQLVAGLLVVALLLGFNGYARYFDISRREAQVMARQQEACKAILGQEVKSAERCLAMMNEQIQPTAEGAGVPEISAIDPYLEVARATPPDVTVKVDELEIGVDRVRVKGMTDSFEAVDKIVSGMQKGRCFHNVQRGPARQTGDKVGFSVTVDVDCNRKPAAPGTPAPAAEAAPPPVVGDEAMDKEG